MQKDTTTQLLSLWGDIKTLKQSVNNLSVQINNATKGKMVSVMDYGAVGDGVTNDSGAIQRALNSGADIIWFPPATYRMDNQVKINSFTTLLGYGAIIRRGSNVNNLLINNADGVTGGYTANTDIAMYGLKIDGNQPNFPTNCTTVAFGHARNIVVRDCEFLNAGGAWHSLELNAVENALVQNCSFHDTLGAELLQLDYMGGSALFPWFGPFDNTPCRFVTVTDNIFYNGASGFGSHSGGAQHTHVIVSNNIFRDLTQHAIELENYGDMVITGNKINNCVFGVTGFGGNGLANQGRTVISNNQITNMTGFGRGITLFGPDDLSITGNVIAECQDGGIDVNNCDRFVIANNILKNTNKGATTGSGFAAIYVNASTLGSVTGNVILKDPTGVTTNTNTISVAGASSNIIIDNNTVATPAGAPTTVFTSVVGSKIMFGFNTINGTVTPYISAKTANYTYTPSDAVINVDTTAGNVTITVNPTIFNKIGLTVRKTSADANTVTITPSSGTINGGASVSLTAQNQVALVTSDWTNLDAVIK